MVQKTDGWSYDKFRREHNNSRLPETFALAQELKLMAWEKDQWEDIGVLSESGSANACSYRVFHISSTG